ncbi:MAG TPA: hypothetical protein VF145_07625 [Chitinophagaceae bacterium]
MEIVGIADAKALMGKNFIGPDEVLKFYSAMGRTPGKFELPEIPFSIEQLRACSDDYLLVLTVPFASDGWALNILNLREVFGMDPISREPCFYNQDWYLNEAFVREPPALKWQLVKKHVHEETRAMLPADINVSFPSAILCTYTFFANYLVNGEELWPYDFVWCNDKDHNNDRIYVGKYRDIDGLNKNGFSIHRHLALRSCYGAISIQE